jgi:hypothetical protein
VQFTEELKRKIQAKPQKNQKKWKKRLNKYTQNRRLRARTVGIKRCSWIKTTDVYWMSLREAKVKQTWRQNVQEKEEKERIKDMNWMPIDTETTSFLLRSQNWTSPGSDQMLN